MILVSACLAGVNCKYNGCNSYIKEVAEIVSNSGTIPVCPEQLGGCTTPRPAAEILDGTGADVLDGKCRVISVNREDITNRFVRGAHEVLKIALLAGVKKAVLKARSPSCGCGSIYDGTFSGTLREGNGVAAELLLRNGIDVLTEEELT